MMGRAEIQKSRFNWNSSQIRKLIYIGRQTTQAWTVSELQQNVMLKIKHTKQKHEKDSKIVQSLMIYQHNNTRRSMQLIRYRSLTRKAPGTDLSLLWNGYTDLEQVLHSRWLMFAKIAMLITCIITTIIKIIKNNNKYYLLPCGNEEPHGIIKINNNKSLWRRYPICIRFHNKMLRFFYYIMHLN